MKYNNMSRRINLLEGEKIILENPIHWRNYIAPVAAMIACLIGIALRLSYKEFNLINKIEPGTISKDMIYLFSYGEVIIMAILLLVLSIHLIKLAYTRYYLTNKRVIKITGWVNVLMSDMLLERIETISLSQRFFERIFDSGDLLCVSAGATIYLDDVYDARGFRQTVINEMTTKKQQQ